MMAPLTLTRPVCVCGVCVPQVEDPVLIVGFGPHGQMLAALLDQPLASLPDPSLRYIAFDLDPSRVQVRGAEVSSAGQVHDPSAARRTPPLSTQSSSCTGARGGVKVKRPPPCASRWGLKCGAGKPARPCCGCCACACASAGGAGGGLQRGVRRRLARGGAARGGRGAAKGGGRVPHAEQDGVAPRRGLAAPGLPHRAHLLPGQRHQVSRGVSALWGEGRSRTRSSPAGGQRAAFAPRPGRLQRRVGGSGRCRSARAVR